MDATLFVILAIFPLHCLAASYDPLSITPPSVTLITKLDGFIGLTSGSYGDVHINPGINDTGSVYLDNEDLLYIIQMIESLPPIWQEHGPVLPDTPYGYLGEYRAGQSIRVQLSAVDPEGLPITYTRVAGDFPPGVRVNRQTGVVYGIIPDADATFSVTMRATDGHGKYADAVFRIGVRGYDTCLTQPCKHEGVCSDLKGDVRCQCVSPYGGKSCDLDCRSNHLGIDTSRRWITDAQMTAYHSYSNSMAYYARVGHSSYWHGIDSSSYLQIDFGNETMIHRIETARATTSYYTSYYYLQHSMDGNNFQNYTSYLGQTVKFSGATGTSAVSQTLATPMSTRFIRIYPISWHTQPALKLDMYGCHKY